MNRIEIPPNSKAEFYENLPEDLKGRHCRTCVYFLRPSIPYLSSWGKCTQKVVHHWCRDHFPACRLFANRTRNQAILETLLTWFVVGAAIFAFVKFLMTSFYFLNHGLPPLSPEEMERLKNRRFF